VGRSLLILLDTHVAIWLSYDYGRISPKAQAAIKEVRKKERGLGISAMTLIEIAMLSSYGRVRLTPDLETFLSEIEQRLIVLPITASIARQAFELPSGYPKDPMDRVIGATALIEDLPLVTADNEIRRTRAIPTIW
jgi:PIN domain nuclease of toxin-antitoxin system